MELTMNGTPKANSRTVRESKQMENKRMEEKMVAQDEEGIQPRLIEQIKHLIMTANETSSLLQALEREIFGGEAKHPGDKEETNISSMSLEYGLWQLRDLGEENMNRLVSIAKRV